MSTSKTKSNDNGTNSQKPDSTALTEQTPGYAAFTGTDFAEMADSELNGLDVGFDRIKIPSAGSTVFEIPDEDGETEPVKEFSAVILYHHPMFCYYKTKYNGGNTPPDCGSYDGVVGSGNPGGECAKCPLNRFDTGENGSKACKNRRRLYILREGEMFPMLLSLPTGSLKEFTKYLKRVLSKGKNSNAFVTRFSLKKATNSSGTVYSQAQFAIDRALAAEEYAYIQKMSEQIKVLSRRVDLDAEGTGFVEEELDTDPETGETVTPFGGGN